MKKINIRSSKTNENISCGSENESTYNDEEKYQWRQRRRNGVSSIVVSHPLNTICLWQLDINQINERRRKIIHNIMAAYNGVVMKENNGSNGVSNVSCVSWRRRLCGMLIIGASAKAWSGIMSAMVVAKSMLKQISMIIGVIWKWENAFYSEHIKIYIL